MRLIDADALTKIIEREIYYAENPTIHRTLNYCLGVIDNAPTVDFEKLGESLNCQIRATYGSCDDCLLSCPRNELIKLLGLARPLCPNCGADMRKGESSNG